MDKYEAKTLEAIGGDAMARAAALPNGKDRDELEGVAEKVLERAAYLYAKGAPDKGGGSGLELTWVVGLMSHSPVMHYVRDVGEELAAGQNRVKQTDIRSLCGRRASFGYGAAMVALPNALRFAEICTGCAQVRNGL